MSKQRYKDREFGFQLIPAQLIAQLVCISFSFFYAFGSPTAISEQPVLVFIWKYY